MMRHIYRTLGRHPFRSRALSSAALQPMTAHHTTLEDITSCIKPLTADHIRQKRRWMDRISTLDLADMHTLSPDIFVEIIHHTRNLESLNINSSRQLLRESLLHNIRWTCPKLKKLSIANGAKFSDGFLMSLAKKDIPLESLNINRVHSFTAESFMALANVGALKSLDADHQPHMDDASIIALAKHGVLERLSLASCGRITSKAIHALADNTAALSTLLLAGTYNIDDDALTALVTQCHALTTLDLAFNRNVTRTFLSALDNTALTTLNLAYAPFVDDSILSCLKSQHLEHLSLKGMSHYTDQGLINLAKHCPSLKTLNVSGNTHITEKSMDALRHHCPKLQKLCHPMSIKISAISGEKPPYKGCKIG